MWGEGTGVTWGAPHSPTPHFGVGGDSVREAPRPSVPDFEGVKPRGVIGGFWGALTPSRPQVRALKEKIEAEKGSDAFPVAGQKLIYAGKILSDDVPIREYRIDEKNFVVVMVTKVKPPGRDFGGLQRSRREP